MEPVSQEVVLSTKKGQQGNVSLLSPASLACEEKLCLHSTSS